MSRHQTSDDHDHGYIKSKLRRQCNIETYKCPICGNTDIHSIGYLNGKPYCRRCISFRVKEAEKAFLPPVDKNTCQKVQYGGDGKAVNKAQ